MIRLAIRCRAEHAELALAELLELAPAGIEEVREDGFVEYAIYGPPGEVPTLPDLKAAVGDGLVEITTTEIADDWHERWRDFHGSVLVGDDNRGRVLLRPTWEPPGAKDPGAVEIVLDPGQAFGTGSHPTTRLCLDLMLDLERSGPAVDIGCGSGILAIAAAKLGWSPINAFDFDPLAVDATIENAERNGVEIATARADIRERLPELAPTIFANLLRPLLLELAESIGRLGDSPDRHGVNRAILSGLLDEEASEVAGVFAGLGLREQRRVSDGGWTALLLA